MPGMLTSIQLYWIVQNFISHIKKLVKSGFSEAMRDSGFVCLTRDSPAQIGTSGNPSGFRSY